MIINTLRPRQNGHHFPDDIFKWILVNEIIWILIKISLKFVPRGQIDNIPALIKIMAWRRDQATSHYLNQLWLVYWRLYVSFSLNELMYYALYAMLVLPQYLRWNITFSRFQLKSTIVSIIYISKLTVIILHWSLHPVRIKLYQYWLPMAYSLISK